MSDGVALWGKTTANQNVDRISVVVYLQQWTGSQWVTLDSQTFTAYETWYVSGTWSATAARGYYYRGFCRHVVTEGNVTEYGESYTDPVMP